MPSQQYVQRNMQQQQQVVQPPPPPPRAPPPPPLMDSGPQGEGDFLCQLCQRFFKSEHALTVHKSTSQYHRQDKKAAAPPSYAQPQNTGGWAGGGALGAGGSGVWKK